MQNIAYVQALPLRPAYRHKMDAGVRMHREYGSVPYFHGWTLAQDCFRPGTAEAL